MKKPKTILGMSACGLVVCLFAYGATSSRFWDSKRVEKSVQANIPRGSSEQSVVKWLSQSGISYRKIINSDKSFSRQSIVKSSGPNPNQIRILVVGSTREGFTPDDLYKIDIYFFFDKKSKLIKYDFQKLWVGI